MYSECKYEEKRIFLNSVKKIEKQKETGIKKRQEKGGWVLWTKIQDFMKLK